MAGNADIFTISNNLDQAINLICSIHDILKHAVDVIKRENPKLFENYEFKFKYSDNVKFDKDRCLYFEPQTTEKNKR